MKRVSSPDVIASVTTSSVGWKRGRIVFRNGPRRPLDGLISPDGAAWEMHPVPRRRDGSLDTLYIAHQQASTYTLALVTVGGVEYLAERYHDNLKPWDGLDVVGEWSDDLSGIPSQCTVRGIFRGVNVVLYLRWRWSDPWTGHVIRPGDGHEDWQLHLDPWSPNLLPTEPPAPPKPLEKKGSLLSFLSGPVPDLWITEEEIGHAKQVLVVRADSWLCEHFDDDKAWTG